MASSPPLISVVVPAHQGEEVLPASLDALEGSDLPRALWELIVVDDCSTDATARIARDRADRLVTLTGGPHGPAHARNRGAENAGAPIVAFVDSDVLVHRDALTKILDSFNAEAETSAVFGAYDTNPADGGFLSQYRNLLHHYVHASNPGPAHTFWAGLGAVRRSAFMDVGMFDENRYPRPQIEDIELGYRLVGAGHRIRLRPDIRGTHLKRWTFSGMVRTDVLDRGIPWMRLLLERPEESAAGTLNAEAGEKLKTALVGTGALAILASAGTLDATWAVGGAAMVTGVGASNSRLYRWFRRQRGALFAARVIPVHTLYYLLNAASALLGWLVHVRRRTLGDTEEAISPAHPISS